VIVDKSARLARLRRTAASPWHGTVLLEQAPDLPAPLPAAGQMRPLALAAPREDLRTLAIDAPFAGIVVAG